MPTLSAHPTKAAMAMWRPLEENLAVGASSVGGLVANVSYGLTAMIMEGQPRSLLTDAAAVGLARVQRDDGSFNIPDFRPPLGGSLPKWTALSIRSLDVYMPKGLAAERDARIKRAPRFPAAIEAHERQDAAFTLLGLKWSEAPADAIRKVRERDSPRCSTRTEGGRSCSGMASDAFATGEALYALAAAGGVTADRPAYKRGVDFLLRTQLEGRELRSCGRADLLFQPYIETGFPHGRDQFISAAATSWAAIALTHAVEAPKRAALR